MFGSGKYEEAVSAYQKLLSAYPNSTDRDLWTFYVGYSYYLLHKLDEATEVTKSGLQQYPDSAFLHNLQGILDVSKKDYEEALAEEQKAVELSHGKPPIKHAWFSIGKINEFMKKWNEALEAYQQAAAFGHPQAAQKVARLKRKIAIADCSRLSRSEHPALPESARRETVQAAALIDAKKFSDAESHYQSAIGIAPWSAAARYNYALLEGSLEHYDEAITQMECYLKLEPRAKDAREAQDQIYTWQAFLKR